MLFIISGTFHLFKRSRNCKNSSPFIYLYEINNKLYYSGYN